LEKGTHSEAANAICMKTAPCKLVARFLRRTLS